MSDQHINALPSGYEFEGYRIERVLGAGGFGITYLATEIALDRAVAIKEYLPVAIAGRNRDDHTVVPVSANDTPDFEWGLDRFRKEAATLVSFRHPNIVSVLRFFEALGTSYLVMEYERGESLEAMIKRGVKFDQAAIEGILEPLLDGLEEVHEKGFLHRDIKPDNIYIREDGSPVLIDFGAARQALSGTDAALTAIVTEGYAPVEQYERESEQGPFTDIYAMAASVYRCITGIRPTEAPKRTTAIAKGNADPLVPIADLADASAYSEQFIAAVEYGLRVFERDRPQTIADWRAALGGAPIPAPKREAAHFPPPSGDQSATVIVGSPAAPAADAVTARAGPEPKSSPAGRSARSRLGIAAAMVVLFAIAAGGGWYFFGRQGSGGPNTTTSTATTPTTVTIDPAKRRAQLEQAVTDARAAYDKAQTVEEKTAAFEKVIAAETALAQHLFKSYEAEGKAATKRATELLKAGKYEESITAAKEGAKFGDPNAMNVLGVIFEEGRGVERNLGISSYWYRRAAELGDEFAQANLAINYYAGRGVTKNYTRAFAWAQRAAVKGHVDAQYLLGRMHETGQGVAKDLTKALEWYERGAAQGDAESLYAAGRMYHNGLGAKADPTKALDYYTKAAARGHAEAKKALAALAEKTKNPD